MIPRRKILITGAAGRIGRILSADLRSAYALSLVDVRAATAGQDLPMMQADVCDAAAMAACCQGMDTVIHLAIGGNVRSARKALERVNMQGAKTVIQAAAAAGCRRVIFASSLSIETEKHNDYAEAKKEIEDWARKISETVPLSILCLRFGFVPPRMRHSMWAGSKSLDHLLSHRDLIQLIRCSIEAPEALHFRVYTAVSANEKECFNTEPAQRELGYAPVDNAYALARHNARTLYGRWRQLKRIVNTVLKRVGPQ